MNKNKITKPETPAEWAVLVAVTTFCTLLYMVARNHFGLEGFSLLIGFVVNVLVAAKIGELIIFDMRK